jgi:hypothetical protein
MGFEYLIPGYLLAKIITLQVIPYLQIGIQMYPGVKKGPDPGSATLLALQNVHLFLLII